MMTPSRTQELAHWGCIDSVDSQFYLPTESTETVQSQQAAAAAAAAAIPCAVLCTGVE